MPQTILLLFVNKASLFETKFFFIQQVPPSKSVHVKCVHPLVIMHVKPHWSPAVLTDDKSLFTKSHADAQFIPSALACQFICPYALFKSNINPLIDINSL